MTKYKQKMIMILVYCFINENITMHRLSDIVFTANMNAIGVTVK